jgi:hypothetical protein
VSDPFDNIHGHDSRVLWGALLINVERDLSQVGCLTKYSQLVHPVDHLVRRTIKSKVKFIVCSLFEPGLFVSDAGAPHRHFVEDRTDYVSEILWERSLGNSKLVVIERERHCG